MKRLTQLALNEDDVARIEEILRLRGAPDLASKRRQWNRRRRITLTLLVAGILWALMLLPLNIA